MRGVCGPLSPGLSVLLSLFSKSCNQMKMLSCLKNSTKICSDAYVQILCTCSSHFFKHDSSFPAARPGHLSSSPQGWEESCDAAVSHLLRTCLSRSPKDQATTLAQTGGQTLGLPRDTERLKRHISLLCDRIAKGGRLTLASEANVQVPAQVQNLAAPGTSV